MKDKILSTLGALAASSGIWAFTGDIISTFLLGIAGASGAIAANYIWKKFILWRKRSKQSKL